ncbi:MAG: site-specific DNA-methyltransferase [Nitrospira sp.]|nr:site-specific DNA-methyltransferase [Nitrospira sp.]
MMKDEPDKLDLRSHNIAEDKRQELLRLFPEIRTEGGKLDFERLKLALGETVDVGKERYGMTWPGKADCFKTIQMPSLATLRPCPEESVNFDTTEHLIIEGDNLEVLKLLQKSYLGKIKMIYIDPPYNTGKDFIYPDNFSESLQTYLEYTGQVDAEGRKFGTNTEADGRFHSKWLNMMYPRLYLARNLLRQDGVIFISIDDKELHNLRRLCDEVFGEENFVAVLVWDRNRKNDAKYFSVGHEYMVVYFKNETFLFEQEVIFRGEKEGVAEVKREFERLRAATNSDWNAVREGLLEFYSKILPDDPRRPLTRFTKVDEQGPYRDDGNINWPGGDGPRYEVLHPKSKRPCKLPTSGWRYSTPERFWEEVKKGRIVFGPDETTVPRVRTNLFENSDQVMVSVHYSYAQTSANQFNALFDGKRIFDNPKPTDDLKRLVAYVTSPDDIILDFFAGSGTTGHAVLDLNKQDGGTRKFILVQLPEPTEHKDYPTIADICKERVRRVIKKLNDAEAQASPQLALTPAPLPGGEGRKQDRGFRVFKLAESNFTPWEAEAPKDAESLAKQLDLHVDHIREGRTEQDLLYEILLKSGFPLTTPVQKLMLPPHPSPLPQGERERHASAKTVYSVAGGALLICLERELTLELIRAMAEKKPERVVCLDAGFAGNDQLKANAVQLFKTKGVTSFKTV